MPDRIWVRYEEEQRQVDNQGDGIEVAATLMRTFENINYELYMTHRRKAPETGNPEITLEFIWKW